MSGRNRRRYGLLTPGVLRSNSLYIIDLAGSAYFVQSIGTELLTNGDFSAWTSDNPSGYGVVLESGSDPMITQVDPSGSAGTGAARFFSSVTANAPRLQRGGWSIGSIYEVETDLSAYVSGVMAVYDTNTTGFGALLASSAGIKRQIGRANGSTFDIRGHGAAPHDFTVNNVSIKLVTTNGVLTGVADGTFIMTFNEPAIMFAGIRIQLGIRVVDSDGALADGWVAEIRRNDTNSNWDFRLDSYSSGVPTNRISVIGIGAVAGMKVQAFGNNFDCWTLDLSDVYTKRGGTITNATWNTSVGVQCLYSTDFDQSNMRLLVSDVAL